MPNSSFLKLKNGGQLAYHQIKGATPGIIFLGGFRSDMTGNKALELEAFCKERGQSFVRFDYRGHGQSSGAFEDGSIGMWLEDAMEVLTRLTRGPQILVGSSMGGWLALLVACLKPRRVAGIIGIAPAPDFTERMFHERFSDAQRREVLEKGRVMLPSELGEPYPITRAFIEDGRKYLLLERDIPVYCPVRLLHGMKDDVVPWEVSFSINEKLGSQDVKTLLIDDGDHRLSRPQDIEKLKRVAAKMLDSLAAQAA